MDGDYDDDRYNSNSDYADGVDDAIEDDYEEGYGHWEGELDGKCNDYVYHLFY